MAKIITFNEIIKANEQLQNIGSKLRVHLHDACGGQSLDLRDDNNPAYVPDATSRLFVVALFSQLGFDASFSADGKTFFVN